MSDYPVEEGALQRTVCPNIPGLYPMTYLKMLHQQVVRSCRIRVEDETRGTGFLIGPNLVLTCLHVIEQTSDEGEPHAAEMGAISVLFSKIPEWDRIGGTIETRVTNILGYSPPSSSEREGHADKIQPTEDELDYALLQLDRHIGQEQAGIAAQRGWYLLPRAVMALDAATPLMICHQPRDRLTLSINTNPNVFYTGGNYRLNYGVNTTNGSSGSLVSTLAGKPLALHQYGAAGGMREVSNHGVPLHCIYTHIIKNFSTASEMLRDLPDVNTKWQSLPPAYKVDDRAAYIYKFSHDILHHVYERYQRTYVRDLMLGPKVNSLQPKKMSRAVVMVRRQYDKLDEFAIKIGYDGAAELDPYMTELLNQLEDAEAEGDDVAPSSLIDLYATIAQAMQSLDDMIEKGMRAADGLPDDLVRLSEMHALWGYVMADLDETHANWLRWDAPEAAAQALKSAKRKGVWTDQPPPLFPSPSEKLDELEKIYELSSSDEHFRYKLQAIYSGMSMEYGHLDDCLLGGLEKELWVNRDVRSE